MDSKDVESTRDYYRVPCDMQVRFKTIDSEEAEIFRSYAIKPSAHSSLIKEIDLQLQQTKFNSETRFVVEKAFQLLLSLDQRLDRIEERLYQKEVGITDIQMNYECVTGDLSASGIGLRFPTQPEAKVGEKVLLDVVLPALPEYRFVATAEVVHVSQDREMGVTFLSIHDDDREYIHHYVRRREREILRLRAQKRDQASE